MSRAETNDQGQEQNQPTEGQDASSPKESPNVNTDCQRGASIKDKIKQGWNEFVDRVNRNDKVVVALSTIVIAAFTFALFVATFLLWKAGERHSERQLRAYVSFPAVEIRNFGTSAPIQFAIAVKNSGQTPAYKVKDRVSIVIAKFPTTVFPPMADFTESTACLGPSDMRYGGLTLSRTLTTDEVALIEKGEWAVYGIYEVIYSDAFGKTQRWAHYRGFYHGKAMTAGPAGGSGLALKQTDEGNDAN